MMMTDANNPTFAPEHDAAADAIEHHEHVGCTTKYKTLSKEVRNIIKFMAITQDKVQSMENKLNKGDFDEKKAEVPGGEGDVLITWNTGNDIWKRVLKTVLRNVLKVPSDASALIECQKTCARRMKDTPEDGITELTLAERLQKQTRLFEWGLALYEQSAHSIEANKSKVGQARRVFMNTCNNVAMWAHLRETGPTNGKDVMDRVITTLRQDNRTMYTKTKEANTCVISIVAPVTQERQFDDSQHCPSER